MVAAADRAVESWAALCAACVRTDRRGRPQLTEGPRGRRAPVWPYAQALAAAVDLDRVTGGHESARWVDGLAVYARGTAYAPTPRERRRYYDDNAWIGLALAQRHRQTGAHADLDHARRVFAFVRGGADPDGGVRWVEGRRSRNACATAPAAQLALRLHLAHHDDDELAFARRSMGWIERTLVLESGMIGDHEDDGRVDTTVWSYNQGAAVGAWTLLARVAGEGGERAARTATASLERFRDGVLWAHPPVFNAIWFRNLLARHAVEPMAGLVDRLDAYLERAWREARDPGTGLFTAGGIGSYDGTPAIDHAGLVQLFALRAWPSPAWADIT